jgi:hypothetical protein
VGLAEADGFADGFADALALGVGLGLGLGLGFGWTSLNVVAPGSPPSVPMRNV